MQQDYDNGKYTVIFNEQTGALHALRNGESWKDLSGNNLVYWMLVEHKRALEQRAELLEALKKCRFDSLNMSLEDWRFVQAAITRAEAAE